MKQTAVEWLVEQMKINNYISDNAHWLIDDTKEMEKEQQGYSEEEVYEILAQFVNDAPTATKEWFNQFKNK